MINYLINLQMDTDTRTGATGSYKEKFSSKEAVELATLQFNPFPSNYFTVQSIIMCLYTSESQPGEALH